jgi:hypothetical protein
MHSNLSLPTPLPALVTAWVRAIETARYEMAFSISLLVSQATGECIGKTQNRMSDKHFVRRERELCGTVLKPL